MASLLTILHAFFRLQYFTKHKKKLSLEQLMEMAFSLKLIKKSIILLYYTRRGE